MDLELDGCQVSLSKGSLKSRNPSFHHARGSPPNPQPAPWAWHPELTELCHEFHWRRNEEKGKHQSMITEAVLPQSAQIRSQCVLGTRLGCLRRRSGLRGGGSKSANLWQAPKPQV